MRPDCNQAAGMMPKMDREISSILQLSTVILYVLRVQDFFVKLPRGGGIYLSACEAQAGAKLAQMLFDQIQERVDIFAACEDRAGERSIAAAFTVVDRSVFFDQTAAVGLAV